MSEFIFISYNKKDLNFVTKLANDLETEGFEVFFEDKNITPGDPILKLIGDALEKAHYVISVLSHNSSGSNWVDFERDSALMESINNPSKKTIPILLDDCTIPKILKGLAYADFGSNYQEGLNSLFKGLKIKTDLKEKQPNLILQEPCTSEIHSYLVRFIIYVLTRSETERNNIMTTLEIDDQTLGLLLRGNSIKRVNQKIITHLPQLTVSNRLFQTTEDAINFITVNEGELNELRSKLTLVIESSHTGKKLRKLLEDYIVRLKMTQEWNKIVQYYSIKDHSNALKAMRKIYHHAGIIWSKSEMRLFVKSDFEKDLWINVIDRSQDQIPKDEWSHLHYANLFLGEQLAGFFSKEREENKKFGSVEKKFNIVEGGVGGANTTHQVLKIILKKCENIEPFKTIQYKGFEINEIFAEQADNILKGQYSDQEKDSRNYFFSSLNKNKKRFVPLSNNIEILEDSFTKKFVENVDMSDGVASLVISQELNQGNIDLFLCSYALHHIPNGHDLRTFIFGGYNSPLDRLDLHSKEGEKFCEDIKSVLTSFIRTKDTLTKLNVKSPYARALIELIDLEHKYPYQINELLKDFKLYIKDNRIITGIFINSSWSNAIIDYQEKFLSEVYCLLRPGGYLAIADPDGYSKYNKENLPKNAEMGVAHFLSCSQLVTLLEKLKFTIIHQWTLIKTKHDNTCEVVTEEPDSKYRFIKDIEDPNLGYIVIAKKPIYQ